MQTNVYLKKASKFPFPFSPSNVGLVLIFLTAFFEPALAKNISSTVLYGSLDQTITFNALPSKNYGGADFNPGATSSSGLAVTYTSSNSSVATITMGNLIHIVGPGTTTITAFQGGNGVYNAATPLPQAFMVNKGNQLITFSSLSAKIFGDSDFSPSAVVNTGLPITYTTDNAAIATIVSGLIHITGAGTVNITASQPGSSNYNAATNVTRSLVVSKKAQTITFPAISTIRFGTADFSPASVNSSLSIVYSSSNLAVASIVGGKVHLTGIGSVTITASQPGDVNNNAATPVSQTFSVVSGTQSISFPVIPLKFFGDADFMPATASSGLNIVYSSSNLAVATIVNGKVHIVGIGNSGITASQPGNANYDAATSVTQTLTVNKGDQIITFYSIPETQIGTPDFSPGATISSGLTITYTSSNLAVATITGDGKIHIVGLGYTNITASRAGDDNYNAASSITQSLHVIKGNQTISFPDFTVKSPSDVDFNPGVTATSGLAVTLTSDNLAVATIVSGKIHIVAVGSANITASQAGDTQYEAAAAVTRTLYVKDTQVISMVPNISKTFGDSDFTLNATASSGLPITYSISNPAIASIVNNQVHIIGAGDCTITASQGGNLNYSPAADVTSMLTVYLAPQTITFQAMPIKQTTDADFDPMATSNAGNEVTVLYTSNNPSVATIVNNKVHIIGPTSPTNTCLITAFNNGSANYDAASPVSKNLTVITTPLGVGLVDYKALKEGNRSRLEWETSSETDNNHFEILKSMDGKLFKTINSIEAKGSASKYIVYDNNPLTGVNYYKLVQIDVDGKVNELGVKQVMFSLAEPVLVSVFPNPFVNNLNLNIVGRTNEKVIVVLTDMLGKIMYTQAINLNNVPNIYKLNVPNIGTGNYILTVTGKDFKKTQTLIKL